MLDLSLFRYPRFVGVQVLPIATCFCYVVLLVELPLRFIGVDGYSEMHVGWMMLAMSAPMLFVPFVAAALTRWMSAGAISGIGLLIAAAGVSSLAGALHGPAGSGALASMFVIGVGAGLPWGLMDGLSVSVVPKSRAGMATGIFSTTRVAGEGVTLAVANALLAAFVQPYLSDASAQAAPRTVANAAARLAAGDLAGAAAHLPEVSRATLQASYHVAFGYLLDGITVITLVCAIGAFVFLSRVRVHGDPIDLDANEACAAGPAQTADIEQRAPERPCVSS